MKQREPKYTLFRLLRRTMRADAGPTRSAAEEGAAWMSHERAREGVQATSEAAARMASTVSRHRAMVDSIADRTRAASMRAKDLLLALGRLREPWERLGLVALNTSLEGARLGETAGHAMQLVSEEVRAHVGRGEEGVREVSATASDTVRELEQLHAMLEQTRSMAIDLTEEVGQVAGAASATEQALTELRERLQKATGTDPETARAIAQATEHATQLVSALGALSTRVPRDLLVQSLRPVLEPLGRFLGDPGAEGESSPR